MNGNQAQIADAKSAWPFKSLAECIEKVSIPNKIPRTSFLPEGALPIISQEADFINGYWNNEADAVRAGTPVVIFGDHTQVLKLVDFDFVVGADGVKILKPKSFLDASFLKYFLEGNPIASLGYARHYRHISGMEVPLPSLAEQKRIVAVLDQAFAALDRARANAEANLADAGTLFDAKLSKVFSTQHENWTSRPLGKVCSKIGSGATPRGGAESYRSEGVSLIRSLNVHDREFRENKLAFIDDKQAEKLSNVVVESKDVLFNITGASVARCCVVPENVLPARVNQHVSILRPEPNVLLPEFLCFLLTSSEQKERLLSTGKEGGSTRQAITKSDLQTLVVKFPISLDLQAEYIESLISLEWSSRELMNAFIAKLQDIDDLRQSLLQKAFSGQLT